LVIILFTVGYKVILRTKWQSADTADLVTGRHIIDDDELAMLDAYYRRPLWRRVATYLSLW
jgi:amino acid transporter